MSETNFNRLLTRREAAEFLGVSPHFMAVLAWRKKSPPYFKLNHDVRYDLNELKAWLETKRMN